MQHSRAVLLLLASIRLVASTVSQDDHPIVGVIDLLKSLKEQVKQEGMAEELTYTEFARWCSNSEKTLDKAIAESKEQIEILESEIEAKSAENETLTQEIAELTQEIAEHQAAAVQAQNVRTAAASMYGTADQDFADTIAAIDDVLLILSTTQDTTEANAASVSASLVQSKVMKLSQFPLVLEQLTAAQRSAMFGNLAQPAPAPSAAPLLAGGDYASHQKSYSFKSGNVIDLLKELKMKFEDDRLAATKAETNSQNEFDLAKLARDNAEAAATDSKTEKETTKSEVEQALVQADADKTTAQGNLDADTQNLASTQQSCSQKQSEWAERSEIRKKEMEAMAAGIDILAKVSGVRTEAPSNPIPPTAPVSLFLTVNQTKPKLSTITLTQNVEYDPKQRAVNLIRKQAQATHSRALAQFAEEVAEHLTGPFDDVNNMIQKMIFRLMAEQKDEDDHKNWCDLEMTKTNASSDEKKAKIAELNTKILASTALAAQLDNQILAANDMVASLEAHIAEATEIRQAGKEENRVATEDAKKAQAAIAQATAVLDKFYKDSGMVAKESWELLQKQKQPVTLPAEPSTWSSGYVGVADPKNPTGVITMLETIAADFAQMESDTLAQEELDQKNYQAEMKSSEIEKDRLRKEAEVKDAEKKRVLDKVAEMKNSLKNTEEQLGAVQQYWKDLGPACMEGDSTYDDRKAAREAEISALKEAQVILQDAFNGGPAPAPAAAFLAPVQRRLAH